MSKITIKAKKDAPETVQIGNLSVEQKDGVYRTDNREFADWIIAQNFGDESAAKPAKARQKTVAKAKPAADQTKPAIVADEKVPASGGEKTNEGETK